MIEWLYKCMWLVSVSVWHFLVFFFFKQKTAYEMRISDWSSDVCSSDLPGLRLTTNLADHGIDEVAIGRDVEVVFEDHGDVQVPQIGRASCRERVCQYV